MLGSQTWLKRWRGARVADGAETVHQPDATATPDAASGLARTAAASLSERRTRVIERNLPSQTHAFSLSQMRAAADELDERQGSNDGVDQIPVAVIRKALARRMPI